MKMLGGHLILDVCTGSPTDSRWKFNVQSVDGLQVTPPDTLNMPERTRRTRPTEEQRKLTDRLMNMSPREYIEYAEEWERTKSARVIGGFTTLKSGDYLEVFEEESLTNSIWQGLITLVPVEDSPYEYATDNIQLSADVGFWNDMFVYEMPAVLYPNFGKAIN